MNEFRIVKMKLIFCIALSLIVGFVSARYGYGGGRHTNIDSSVQVGSGTNIGDHTNINSNCVIGNNVRIGRHCSFGSGNKIHDNVYIGGHVTVRENNEIVDGSELKDHVGLGSDIKIGSNTLVIEHSAIDNFVSIANGCILDSHSSLGSNANIGSFVYCGEHSSIAPQAVIGDNAVILRHATVQTSRPVNNNEVVIRAPTSLALYSSCLPLRSIQQNDVAAVSQYSLSSDVSPEANTFLSEKITEQLRYINSNCHNVQNLDFTGVALIKSLYLILYHGINDFKSYSSQLNGSTAIFLSTERHFGRSNVLTPEATDLMIRLLVLEEDARRIKRVTGDTFCKMSADILSTKRSVRVDQ